MTGHLERIYILLAYKSLFSPASALFPSKLLSKSSIWLPSQIRTEELKIANGHVNTKPASIAQKNTKDFRTM